LSQKLAHLAGSQRMTSSEYKQDMHKHTAYHANINKISEIQNGNNFFIENYKTFPIFRGFEQFSSSIWWLVMAIYNMGRIYLGSTFMGMEFLPIFWFWAIILVPDMLENQSRALKAWMIT